jgi:hypothetical protein
MDVELLVKGVCGLWFVAVVACGGLWQWRATGLPDTAGYMMKACTG